MSALLRRLGRIITRLPYIVWYLVVFLWELVKSNLKVAREVITPGFQMQVAIVRVPTDCRTSLEVTALANTLTMTPGTLSLEVDTDTNDLFVHSLYVSSREEFIADIKAIERVLLKALR